MRRALLNPPPRGEYQVLQLGESVRTQALSLGLEVRIESLDNPCVETESHYYRLVNQKLLSLEFETARSVRRSPEQHTAADPRNIVTEYGKMSTVMRMYAGIRINPQFVGKRRLTRFTDSAS